MQPAPKSVERISVHHPRNLLHVKLTHYFPERFLVDFSIRLFIYLHRDLGPLFVPKVNITT